MHTIIAALYERRVIVQALLPLQGIYASTYIYMYSYYVYANQ